METNGLQDISSASAEAIEFLGAYTIARAYTFESEALRQFIRVLKPIVLLVVLGAVVDFLFNQWLLRDIIASVIHSPPLRLVFRNDRLRAISTFDHPILLGAFCCIAAILFMYSQRGYQRLLFLSTCVLGITLSQSSAPGLSFLIALTVRLYDWLLQKVSWRWYFLTLLILGWVALAMLLSNDPVAWIVGHLTLDPVSGYYRMQIWDAAASKIDESPLFGFGFQSLGSYILDYTVDSVWLVYALRFGLPMIALFFITNIATFVRNRPQGNLNGHTEKMQTAFTLVLMTFALMGLTVHFWNFMWIFWGICVGIRASLREHSLMAARANRSSLHAVQRSTKLSST